MKWTRATGLISTFALVAAGALWAGCSGDDTKTDGGGNDATTNDSGGNDSATDSAGNDSGGDDGGLAVDGSALDCNYYCSTIMQVCNGPSTQQYVDDATCLAMCAGIPNDAGAGITSGDSLACRMYHLSVAAQSAGSAATHCPHAGPYGYGQCGDICQDFCEQFFASGSPCKTDTTAYASADVCRTYCSTAPGSEAGAGAPGNAQTTPAMLCKQYHLENAYKTGGNGGGHCDHAGAVSAGGTCPD